MFKNPIERRAKKIEERRQAKIFKYLWKKETEKNVRKSAVNEKKKN